MMRGARAVGLLAALSGALAFAPQRRLRASPSSLRMSAGAKERAPWAIIFDCDGVLLESEELHRAAYNKAFRHYEIDHEWSEAYYDDLQNRVGGGIPKMRHYFTDVASWPESTVSTPGLSKSKEEQDAFLETVQATKTQMYKDMVAGGDAVLRPGVRRLIEEAVQAPERPQLSICSASTKAACLFVLDNLLGKQGLLEHFDLVLAGEDVENRKPAPDIYQIAAKTLGRTKDECIIIEDSMVGLNAAKGAEMKCVITTTPSTRTQPFAEAVLVVDDLEAGKVTLQTLKDLLKGPAPAATAAPKATSSSKTTNDPFSELVELAEGL